VNYPRGGPWHGWLWTVASSHVACAQPDAIGSGDTVSHAPFSRFVGGYVLEPTASAPQTARVSRGGTDAMCSCNNIIGRCQFRAATKPDMPRAPPTSEQLWVSIRCAGLQKPNSQRRAVQNAPGAASLGTACQDRARRASRSGWSMNRVFPSCRIQPRSVNSARALLTVSRAAPMS
jgi:hypothetical protein